MGFTELGLKILAGAFGLFFLGLSCSYLKEWRNSREGIDGFFGVFFLLFGLILATLTVISFLFPEKLGLINLSPAP